MAGCGGSFFGNEEPFCHAKGTAIQTLKETDALGQCVHAEMLPCREVYDLHLYKGLNEVACGTNNKKLFKCTILI